MALALGAFLFVAQQLPLFSPLHWFASNLGFYLVLPILAGLVAWLAWRHSSRLYRAWYRSLLVTFLPIAVILAIGISVSREFHYLVFLSVGLYLIAAFIYWAWGFIVRHPAEASPQSGASILTPLSLRDQNRRQHTLLVALLTLVFLGFGMHDLTHFAAVDEPLWLDGRIGKFWKNLAEQKMDKTLVSDKPGITIVWATGPALFVVDPSHYRETRFDYQAKNPELAIEHFYLAFRLPLLLTITALLPLFYLLLVPLIGRTAALFAYAGISLSPILIGMSKIVNPDSLLWLFAPLSFLAYIVFLEKKFWRYLVLSGVFLGLALLTKYVANFLIVYFFGLIFLYTLWQGRSTPNELRSSLKSFFLWLGIGLATLYLFVPAFWVRPAKLLTSTLFSQAFEKVSWLFIAMIIMVFLDQLMFRSRGSTWMLATLERLGQPITSLILGFFTLSLVFTFTNSLAGMPWVHFAEMLASPKSASQIHSLLAIFFTHFYPLTFGSTPLILIGVGVMLWHAWRKKRSTYAAPERLTLATIVFILLYYVGSTINEVTLISRYQIMLYPLIAIIGGLGLASACSWLAAQWRARIKPHWSVPTITGALFSVILVFLVATPLSTPFPLSYASSLLPERFIVDVKDMGAGSYEAAQYLNSLPNAKAATIWTDKSGVCKFYVGPCLDGLTFKKLKDYRVQYVVLSSGRESRTHRMFTANNRLLNDEGLIRFDQYYHQTDPLFEFDINGRPSQSVKVFPLK